MNSLLPTPRLSRRHFLTLAALAPLAVVPAADAANTSNDRLEPLMEPWGDVSPNGQEIAFSTVHQEIYVARTNGSGTRRLVGDNSYMPAYAPDGKTIAFISAREYLEHGHTTYVITADGTSEPRRLTEAGERGDSQLFPNWSHDSQKIAVVQRSARGGILLPVHGTQNTVLGPASLNCLLWSPKRDELLATGRRADDTGLAPSTNGLYRVSAGGVEWTRLLDQEPVYAFPPAWSPDGRRIAVTCYGPARTTAIYVVTADGKKAAQCLSPTSSHDGAPVWSPDGKALTFTTGDDIWTMRADGTHRFNVTRSGGYNSYPRWLPDGKTLIFVSKRDRGYNLYRIQRDGSDLKQLTGNNNVGRKASMFQ